MNENIDNSIFQKFIQECTYMILKYRKFEKIQNKKFKNPQKIEFIQFNKLLNINFEIQDNILFEAIHEKIEIKTSQIFIIELFLKHNQTGKKYLVEQWIFHQENFKKNENIPISKKKDAIKNLRNIFKTILSLALILPLNIQFLNGNQEKLKNDFHLEFKLNNMYFGISDWSNFTLEEKLLNVPNFPSDGEEIFFFYENSQNEKIKFSFKMLYLKDIFLLYKTRNRSSSENINLEKTKEKAIKIEKLITTNISNIKNNNNSELTIRRYSEGEKNTKKRFFVEVKPIYNTNSILHEEENDDEDKDLSIISKDTNHVFLEENCFILNDSIKLIQKNDQLFFYNTTIASKNKKHALQTVKMLQENFKKNNKKINFDNSVHKNLEKIIHFSKQI